MNNIEQRIFDIVSFDKKKTPDGLNEIIKSEIVKVLRCYFDIDEKQTLIKIERQSDNTYSIKLASKAKDMRPINILV